jgi:hypothetical protein
VTRICLVTAPIQQLSQPGPDPRSIQHLRSRLDPRSRSAKRMQSRSQLWLLYAGEAPAHFTLANPSRPCYPTRATRPASHPATSRRVNQPLACDHVRWSRPLSHIECRGIMKPCPNDGLPISCRDQRQGLLWLPVRQSEADPNPDARVRCASESDCTAYCSSRPRPTAASTSSQAGTLTDCIARQTRSATRPTST